MWELIFRFGELNESLILKPIGIMPVRQIVTDLDAKILGRQITFKEYEQLKENYLLQNKTVIQNGKIVADSLSAWMPLNDIVELFNKIFKDDVLTLKSGFEGVGLKMYYGAHGHKLDEIKVADQKINKILYTGLHTVMLVATNNDYNPDNARNSADDILDKPINKNGEEGFVVDGVHLCQPNCP